jgi:hypothetical protein
MGHKQKVGNQAHHYDPEDDAALIREYDHYLAPYLGLNNTTEPDEAASQFKDYQLEKLQLENTQLKEQLLILTQFLTQQLREKSQ